MNTQNLVILMAMIAFSSAANAQGIDGLYQPAGQSWSCSPDLIGQDGGALAIQNGILDGVGNQCELTAPVAVGDGTRFTAVCMGEGSKYSETLTIEPTETGVRIERSGYTTDWSRCKGGQDAVSTSQVPNGVWGYGDGYAGISVARNSFYLSCEPFNPSSTYPTASMMVPCPACFPREITSYTLRVDDSFTAEFEFERISNAEGSSSDLGYYPEWYAGLVPALMAGTTLEIIEESAVIATFPLKGSSKAIGALRAGCN